MSAVIYFPPDHSSEEFSSDYHAMNVSSEDFPSEMTDKMELVGYIGEAGINGGECTPLYRFNGTQEEFDSIQLSQNSTAYSFADYNGELTADRSNTHGSQPFETYQQWQDNTGGMFISEISGASQEAEAIRADMMTSGNHTIEPYDLKTEEECTPKVSSNEGSNGGYGTDLASQGTVFKPFG